MGEVICGESDINVDQWGGVDVQPAAPKADGAALDAANVPEVGAMAQGFNGTTWDRIRTGIVGVQTAFVGLLNSISMGRYNATPPTLADGNVAPLQLDSAGNLRVTSAASSPSTATVTSVASNVASVTLLAINAARRGGSIVNESNQIVYVKMGTTASATSYTVAIAAMTSVGGYWEIPFGYTGRIDAIWASANGSARITEYT